MTTRDRIGVVLERIGSLGRNGRGRTGARPANGSEGGGFTLPEYVGLIPCPQCGRTDCAWFVADDEDMLRLARGTDPEACPAGAYCSTTGRRVRPEQLHEAAEAAGLPRTA